MQRSGPQVSFSTNKMEEELADAILHSRIVHVSEERNQYVDQLTLNAFSSGVRRTGRPLSLGGHQGKGPTSGCTIVDHKFCNASNAKASVMTLVRVLISSLIDN